MNIKNGYSTLNNLKKNEPDYLYKKLENKNLDLENIGKFDLWGGLRKQGLYKSSNLDKPLISVITVSLNSEKTIEKTIQSVLNQNYDNVEFIIIDGKSSDQTFEIIKKYETKLDLYIDTNKNKIQVKIEE